MDRKTKMTAVTFKNPNVSLPAEDIKEIDDYVNAAACTVDKVEAASGQKFPSFTESLPPLAVCWLTLVLIVALRIYFTSVISENNNKLTAENQDLKTLRNNLTQQIQNMERKLNELNISRAQWSIDAYCPNGSNGRKCNACQRGWDFFQSSCYAFNYAEPPNQQTWEEARENCKGKISDLAVIDNDTEKDYIRNIKWLFDKVSGYWIGLRAEEGTWKWVDGSNLTQSSWIQQPPTNGLCVIFDKTNVWKAVNCSDKYAWVCKKKALSV